MSKEGNQQGPMPSALGPLKKGTPRMWVVWFQQLRKSNLVQAEAVSLGHLDKGRRGLEPLNLPYHPLTGPTMSETWETVVPEAAPRYSTLHPGLMWIWSTPPRMAAASLERKGFQARYSILSSPSWTRRSKMDVSTGFFYRTHQPAGPQRSQEFYQGLRGECGAPCGL